MTVFRFTGRDARGVKVTGSRDSSTADTLASELLAQRIVPLTIDVQVEEQGDLLAQLNERFRSKKIELLELITFCRQMHSLSKAGVPIIRAIGGLAESNYNQNFCNVLMKVRSDLDAGMSLAMSFNAHPKVFNTLVVSMISVGENTGQLDLAFRQLAIYLELERETRKRIKQATRYPMFVFIAMGLGLTVINLVVIPAFARIFAQFHAQLPLPTRFLIGMSQFFQDYWWLLGLMVVGGIYGFSKWTNTDAGALRWDQIKLRLPIVGGLFERIALGRFTRTFAMMYRAGVPLLQTLSINSVTVSNRYIGRAILRCARRGARRSIDLHCHRQRLVYPTGAANDVGR